MEIVTHVVGIGLIGNRGGVMRELCDLMLGVPSHNTPRIQEGHLTLGHIMCGFLEAALLAQPA